MTHYKGNPVFQHDTPPCTGVLVTNLGTPDGPTTTDVRRYLAEFLSDPRVIEVPKLLWWPVLHGIILRTRPRRSAEAYEKVWTEQGSPLLSISLTQAKAIQADLAETVAGPVHIELAMRYGQPSIADALDKLRLVNAQRLLVFPLYPQYSATTTASTFDAVTNVLQSWRWLPELRMVRNYHDNNAYIKALVLSIREHWAEHGKPDKLLMSFHGLPKHYFLAGDPYYCECQKTARLVATKMELGEDDWSISFQSRFGPREWLQPYTDKLLKKWGKSNIKHVQVICPGFSADCLETLEEIALQNRDFFNNAGGEKFSYIPALNDHPAHITALTEIINRHCASWPEFSPQWNDQLVNNELSNAQTLSSRLKGNL